MDAFGNDKGVAFVPARSVQNQDNLSHRPDSRCLGEVCQRLVELLGVGLGQAQEKGSSALGLHEAVQVEPLVTGFHDTNRTRAFLCPDPPDNRQQADAVFVKGPHFDAGGRKSRFDLGGELRKRFF
jgi:hypothetical protein